MDNELSREETKQQLQQMDPYKLEKLIGDLWSAMGYETTVRKGSGDRGIDIIATKQDPFERKQLLQVKRYSESNLVGSQEIRQYRTLYDQEPDAEIVAIITTSDLTPQASELAADLGVRAMDGDELSCWLLQELGVDKIQSHLGLEENRSDTEEQGPKYETKLNQGEEQASDNQKDLTDDSVVTTEEDEENESADDTTSDDLIPVHEKYSDEIREAQDQPDQ